MEHPQSPKKARAPARSRKSIAHMPSPDVNIDKENVTIDSVAHLSSITQAKSIPRKPRSKSIGPGGLDMLKEDAGNRHQPAVAQFVKSILKPTICLSPPKQIPPHPSSRRTSPRSNSRTTPEKAQSTSSSGASLWKNSNPVTGSHELPNPFEGPADSTTSLSLSRNQTKVAVRTEAEQHAAANAREQQEVLNHKDARRKSLANRRVSFAPEATLHTWDVVEIPEDSTTSSASTNSTRRASALSTAAASPYPQPRSQIPGSDASEPPSTPSEQVEEIQVTASPAQQRDLHQKKHRRSSGIPPMNFNDPDDLSSSPGSVPSDDTGSQAFVTPDEEVGSSNSDDDDVLVEGEDTTGMNDDDITTLSNDGLSTGSSGKLEEALRQAAEQAGTQGIDYDEHGDITMEIADEEITAAFKPWMKKGKYVPQIVGDPSALQDQENTNPFSPAFKANFSESIRADESERVMDFTQAVGAILPCREEIKPPPESSRQKSATGSRRRSSGTSRRSSGDDSVLGDETMDLTTAIGGIQQNKPLHDRVEAIKDSVSVDGDEELTMEFTSVLGGLLERRIQDQGQNGSMMNDHIASRNLSHVTNHRRDSQGSYDEEEMDFTIAQGGILPSITERTEPAEDQTMDLDINAALGAILPQKLSTGNKTEAKQLMEREVDTGQLLGSPLFGNLLAGSETQSHAATIASDTGSPSLTASQRRVNPRKNAVGRQSVTPKPESRQSTPLKKPSTPSKQLTPKLARPTTPGKTPPSKNISMRTGSPKKLFKAEIKMAQPNLQPLASNLLFRNNANSKEAIPSIIRQPRHRRSSGLGIDKEGLGSPRVTALLDRRRSIGEDAKVFAPQDQLFRGVRFDDPKVMEEELENQRTEDERRESGRVILQMEADSHDFHEEKDDATTNLKDMIESLTPQKKRKLNGRKSLHVGAAKGLLGKRPAELDEDDDEDLTPKRLKGREGSPVKKVRLPAPPSKVETTGRVTRSGRRSLTESTGKYNVSTPSRGPSPLKKSLVTTPKSQPRFKDADRQPSTVKLTIPSNQKLETEKVAAISPAEQDERIHLQDFLNMTSIRFMELTTTKRRLTVAPSVMLESSVKKPDEGAGFASSAEKNSELENCVVAGACTVPMLELYQHSCRELKKYIAEGRSIVREIEADTFEDNPALFREYISAPADIKSIMDNQFKNVKTHARLLSKAMWYEWRMKLLDGLKDGLLRVGEGMDEDDRLLAQQECIVESVLPKLVQKHDRLEADRQTLQAQVDELASCDQEELQDARDKLITVEKDVQTKQKLIEDLQHELRRHEAGFENAIQSKQRCLEEIKEAEKIRQEYRGWNPPEVAALQVMVDAVEKAHGWTIISASGTSLTMTYKRTLQLFFTPSSFKQTVPPISPNTKPENSPISLTYIADADEYHPQFLTTEKRFFLQIIRAQLQCLPQSRMTIKGLLGLVGKNWEKACVIADEVSVLDNSFITEPMIQSDEMMTVRSMALLRDIRTKIEIGFKVTVQNQETSTELDVAIRPTAKVVYGEGLKENKMLEFIEEKIEGKRERGVWAKTIRELKERLNARGRK